jgi:hypothetical protein
MFQGPFQEVTQATRLAFGADAISQGKAELREFSMLNWAGRAEEQSRQVSNARSSIPSG